MSFRKLLRSFGAIAVMTIVTLAALEILLRVVDLRELREGVSERSLSYQYAAELGWLPIPGSSSTVTNARTIHAHHNSLGLRDDERRGLRMRCGCRELRNGQSGRGKQHDAKVCHDDLGPWKGSGSNGLAVAERFGGSING